MKRFPFFVCLAFLLLLIQTGITSATTTATTAITASTTASTTAVTTAATATTPDRTGGSIFFETDPTGASIWVDNNEIGMSDLTYYSEKPGTLNVLIRRKGYEDFTVNVTVDEGRLVKFYAQLTPLPRGISAETTPAVPVTTATTIRKSTMSIPTPWPTTTESPVDPAVIIGAAAIGTGFCVIRRR